MNREYIENLITRLRNLSVLDNTESLNIIEQLIQQHEDDQLCLHALDEYESNEDQMCVDALNKYMEQQMEVDNNEMVVDDMNGGRLYTLNGQIERHNDAFNFTEKEFVFTSNNVRVNDFTQSYHLVEQFLDEINRNFIQTIPGNNVKVGATIDHDLLHTPVVLPMLPKAYYNEGLLWDSIECVIQSKKENGATFLDQHKLKLTLQVAILPEGGAKPTKNQISVRKRKKKRQN